MLSMVCLCCALSALFGLYCCGDGLRHCGNDMVGSFGFLTSLTWHSIAMLWK